VRFNRKKFFDGVKDRIDATLTQSQVEGLNVILEGIELSPVGWSVQRAAYALATIFHETAGTFQPIHEYGGAAYFNRRYNPNTAVGKRLGNTKPGDGARFAGRGYVQLTGRSNYRKFGIEDTPDDAMKPDIAFHILDKGMHDGTFTGKKFGDYITGAKTDYVNARRIINGTDKAGMIAGYAKSFEKILKDSAATPQTSNSAEPSDQTTANNPPVEPSEQPPIIHEGTVETTVIDGSPVVEKTTDTAGTVAMPVAAAYKDVGLFAVLKKDFAAVGGGNLSFQLLQEYATQASGLPAWVISLIVKLATIAIVLGIAWLLFRFGHYVIWKIGEYGREKTVLKINSDPRLKDVVT